MSIKTITKITIFYSLMSGAFVQTKSFEQITIDYLNKASIATVISTVAGLRTAYNIYKMNNYNATTEKAQREDRKKRAIFSGMLTIASGLYAFINYKYAKIINWYTLSPLQTD